MVHETDECMAKVIGYNEFYIFKCVVCLFNPFSGKRKTMMAWPGVPMPYVNVRK